MVPWDSSSSNRFIHGRGSQWGFHKLAFKNIRPLVLETYIKRDPV